MKAYAVAKDIAVFRQAVRFSKWDALQLENGTWLATFDEPRIADIQKCRENGVVFLPPMDDLEANPSAEFLEMIPAAAGLTANDTPLRAAKKLFQHTKWGPHNPVRW